MPFEVWLTDDAARDLADIHDYIATNRAEAEAEYVLGRIEQATAGLSESPERGTYPKELLALGIQDYREVFFQPYRIVYRVAHGAVYILLIVDGRRDLQTLLQRRLLEP
ncbi:MAG: type II toxin-antitoxin system RelE/ParE family toxin [Thermoleophilia bacterium]|nr:type II toxin-antitoxin system RelE/ParE family toxin [Thermoleophilia bacterium]